ncbi:hypothetical protein D917_06908 [Trichinella nativa]|uniref:SCP domain-containing protein n=1 Tax=Trichinella nativa TaxID=6335 RepID=A0A1Y3ERT0_9BILA|nr:hypothetical protein D917_06908 [Trichinella nativa]
MSTFTTHGIAYSVHKEMPTVDDVVRAFYNEGKYYDKYTGSCSIANGCANFKQFAWFEANALGCGLTKCEHLNHGSESGYFAVCAYSTKARAGGYPFAPALDCLTCPTEKPLCSRKYHCFFISEFFSKRLYVFNCAIPVELVNVSSVLTCAMIDPLLKHKLTPAFMGSNNWFEAMTCFELLQCACG